MHETEEKDEDFTPQEKIVFHNPEIVSILFHEKRNKILNLLVEQEMTAYDLKKILNLNPGIIKRHLDILTDSGLIVQTRISRNNMGMRIKYYRVIAKEFIIHLVWKPT
ncbi:MAG: ArsR/SmtB family transcription factor [Promethearchaeota archaeon]